MQDKQGKTLTEGPIGRSLLRFALPVILSMLTAQFYTIADTMIVGLKMDANALAAVSNASTLLMFFLFVSGGMELGGNLLMASHKPVYTREQLSQLIYNLLFLDGILGLLMLGLGFLIFRPLLMLINTPAEIVDSALLYGLIYLCGIPFQMIYDLSRELLIGYGNSNTPLRFVIFTSLLNIVLDFILVDFWGVAGAAIASAFAQLVGCVGVFLWLKRHLLVGSFRFSHLQKQHMLDIARLAPPNMLQQMAGPIVSAIKQGLLGTLGVAAIAGFSCASKVSNLMLMPIFGSAQALVTFIAQNYALGQTERIKQGIRAAYKILFALTAVLILICVFLNKPILHLFTTDPEVIVYGSILLTWEPLCYMVQVIRHIQEARLRGHQKMLLYLVSSLGTMAINVVACILLVPHVGYSGFYLSTYISSACAVFLSSGLVKYAGA